MLFFMPDILQFYLKIIYSHFIKSGTGDVWDEDVVKGFVLFAGYSYFFVAYPPVLLLIVFLI